MIETQINKFTALYDDINGDELKLEMDRLRRSIQLSAPLLSQNKVTRHLTLTDADTAAMDCEMGVHGDAAEYYRCPQGFPDNVRFCSLM